jgi:hypothetical protein
MCGLGAMASVLTAKVQNVLLNHRKSTPKSDGAREEKRRSSQANRVIPPEPVQEKPEGDFTHHEIAPALSAHNLARATKGSKKLEWDDRLSRNAEAYAKHLAERRTLEPSGVEDEGENVFMSKEDATLEDAVQSWLSQEKKYTGQIVAGGNFDDWGHFCKQHPVLCNSISHRLIIHKHNAFGTRRNESAWAKRSLRMAKRLLSRDTVLLGTPREASPFDATPICEGNRS